MNDCTAAVSLGDDRLPKRFWTKVQPAPNGCWHWTAVLIPTGHGQFWWQGRMVAAHRFIYMQLVEPSLSPDLHVDHQCHNLDLQCNEGDRCLHRRCVNLAHLRSATPRVNTLAGRAPSALNAVKEFCPSGHPLNGDNLRISTAASRQCRTCRQAHAKAQNDREYQARHPHLALGEREQPRAECPKGHPFDEANTYMNTRGYPVCKTCKRDYQNERRRLIGRPDWRRRQA